ncbi:hypothetical protein E2C01_045219 [Portunus trituberculatus]|uniref:Uncharacterized protein n=1 Tax=Portunus trituberculatus TaxID=210409 RepID=A0A5B7G1E0_PORTR|nr:hypothetical protein [Portunus trituberculatus]
MLHPCELEKEESIMLLQSHNLWRVYKGETRTDGHRMPDRVAGIRRLASLPHHPPFLTSPIATPTPTPPKPFTLAALPHLCTHRKTLPLTTSPHTTTTQPHQHSHHQQLHLSTTPAALPHHCTHLDTGPFTASPHNTTTPAFCHPSHKRTPSQQQQHKIAG